VHPGDLQFCYLLMEFRNSLQVKKTAPDDFGQLFCRNA